MQAHETQLNQALDVLKSCLACSITQIEKYEHKNEYSCVTYGLKLTPSFDGVSIFIEAYYEGSKLDSLTASVFGEVTLPEGKTSFSARARIDCYGNENDGIYWDTYFNKSCKARDFIREGIVLGYLCKR